jgi:hypothetical protein
MDDSLKAAVASLEAFVEQDGAGEARLQARREAWAGAKDRILSALEELTSAAKTVGNERGLIAREQPDFGYKNFGAVQLHFGDVPTGVVLVKGQSSEAGSERGAALVIGQSESGLLAVDFFPFFTELPGQRGTTARSCERLLVIEPDEIDRATVLRLVVQFFERAAKTSIRSADATNPTTGSASGPRSSEPPN